MKEEKKGKIRTVLVLVSFSLIFVVWAGLNNKAGKEKPDIRRVQSRNLIGTISAIGLYKEYDDNEVAADLKYKGKAIIVSGTIQDIGKDIMDNAYIVIGGRGLLDGVHCTFTESHKASVARLFKGQQIRVMGEVRGKMIGDVLVNECSLQE